MGAEQEGVVARACIDCSALRLARGGFVLQVPSWQVERGQVVGLVGPNGSGKTTLLDGLAGLLPFQGRMRVLGLDPQADGSDLRLRLGYAAPHLAVWDLPVDRLASQLARFWPSWDEKLCAELLRRFCVPRNERPSRLSSGQLALLKVTLAMAFVPELLLLDEPSAGLDAALRRALLQELRKIAQDEQRTVVLSTHFLDDVERVADALLVLDAGNVRHGGPTDLILRGDRTLAETMLVPGAP